MLTFLNDFHNHYGKVVSTPFFICDVKFARTSPIDALASPIQGDICSRKRCAPRFRR